MDLKMYWAYLAALAVPFLCGLLTKTTWAGWKKFMVTVALSAVIGAVTTVIRIYVAGAPWEWDNIAFYLSIVGEAEIIYRVFVKNVPGLPLLLAKNGVK
jgi:hypothetical protein